MAQAVPGQAIKFKTRDGFVDLDAAGMKAVAIAVGRHVQECFAKEAEALAGISSGAITDAAGIDTLFAKAFPNNRSG